MKTPTLPRFENGRFVCPACWVTRGLEMPFTGSQTCRCGYVWPEWMRRPDEAYSEALSLYEAGMFDIAKKAVGLEPDELCVETSTNSLVYRGYRWPIVNK